MYTFFVKLYYALFSGEWFNYTNSQVKDFLNILINKIITFLINALGGNFSVLQDFQIFDSSISAQLGLALLMSLVTFIGVAFATWKVIKYFFSIFFYGWRN